MQINKDKFQEVATKSLDERHRITFGSILKGIKRVRVFKNSRGEILLEPMVEIPASELWLYQNNEAFVSVKKGLIDAAEGKISKLDLEALQD